MIASTLPTLLALALAGPVAEAPSPAGDAAPAPTGAVVDAPREEGAVEEEEGGAEISGAEATPAESAPTPAAPPPSASPTGARAPASTGMITATTRRPRSGKAPPRYHRAPFTDADYAGFLGQEVLMVFSTGYRVCGTLTAVDRDTVHYDDPSEGERRIARAMVTAVHEGSWECDRDSAVPKVEWALPGAITGLTLAGLGLVFGVLEDAKGGDDRIFKRPSSYAILGLPTTLLPAPIVGIAGHSTARDLRVRGIPWARGVGWAAYGGAALSVILWSVGHLGGDPADPSPVNVRGLALAAGGLGALGTGLLAADALRSRREMIAVRKLDAMPATLARNLPALREVRFGAAPLPGAAGRPAGLGFGVSGRF